MTYVGSVASSASLPGATVRRLLPSIDGAAVSLDSEGALTLGAALLRSDPSSVLPGVEKIWLDGPMSAALDESVPQIGAPAVWEQGYDGTDVTIAVVDTGIDETHPDLAGRVVAAEEFSETGSTTDVLGHGTHVASIAAGSGAASDGQYTGVAFGADLVNAKVLDDDGFGQESWVIAGMEWAAIEQDADVINMSITGGPSDGTDPVSQVAEQPQRRRGGAVRDRRGQLRRRTGDDRDPLHCRRRARGRCGRQERRVRGLLRSGTTHRKLRREAGDRGAGRGDHRGPRRGVGDRPAGRRGLHGAHRHVDGCATRRRRGRAAARRQSRTGAGRELKNALVTSAADVGATAFQQGGGRVDVAAALDQTVTATCARSTSVRWGSRTTTGETSSADVTFTNDGDTEIDLDLAVTAFGEGGEPVPAGDDHARHHVARPAARSDRRRQLSRSTRRPGRTG